MGFTAAAGPACVSDRQLARHFGLVTIRERPATTNGQSVKPEPFVKRVYDQAGLDSGVTLPSPAPLAARAGRVWPRARCTRSAPVRR
jgi:hypothetical protein